MKLERAELRAAVQATEAAAEDTGGKVMDASFAEFLGILNGVDRMDKETFNAALDNMNAAQYLAASRAAAQCYRAAFDVPEDGEETEDTADGDEKNAPTTPADGTGTEAW